MALAGAVSLMAAAAGCDDSNSEKSGAGGAAANGAAGKAGTGAGGAAGTAGSFGQRDLVDTAVAAGSFTKLVAAVQAADLVATLKGAGPFTVFAPTDAAFAKLPAGTLDDLLAPANKPKLQAVLTYHVVAGKVLAADVVKLTEATTVQGSDLTVSVTGSTVKINDATVTATDVLASNGVIHVIDTVLIPPSP